MENWKILALSLGLSVVLCGCNMGAAGGIGTDGAVQVGGSQEVAVSENTQTETPTELTEIENAQETQDKAPAAAEEEAPDLTGLQTYEEEETPDATELNLDQEENGRSLAGSIFTSIPQKGNPTLDEVLNQLADPQVAAEISAYYAEKANQAAGQGQTVTTEVQYSKGTVLSVLRTLKDSAGIQTLRSETFSTANAGLYTLADFFPGVEESVWRKTVVDALTSVLSTSGKELFSEWRTYAANSFDPDCFYLASDGLCIYYQAGVLSQAAQTVTVPYSRLTGFVMQGQ